MKCERCGKDQEAKFRVISDIVDMKVCADCAAEARRLAPSLKIVEIEKAKNEQSTSKAEVPAYLVAMPSQSTHWQSATMCYEDAKISYELGSRSHLPRGVGRLETKLPISFNSNRIPFNSASGVAMPSWVSIATFG
jgi:hypothetical protein